MSTILPTIYASHVISNLDTYTHTTLNTSMYTASIQLTEQPPSGVTIALTQNSTTIASTSTPAASQSVVDLQGIMNCTAGDTINFAVSSSSAIDKQPISIKGIITIRQGSN